MTTPPETAAPPISGAEARRAARNAGAIAAASLLSRGLQFGWQLILASGLGPAAFGVYGAAAAFIMVGAPLVSFGMGPIVIRDVARRPEQAGRYLASLLLTQTLLALAAYVGINAAAALAGYSETVRVFAAIAGLSLFMDALGNQCHDLLLAHERMAAASAVTVAHIVLLIALAGAGLAAGYGLFGVYAGVLLAGALRSAALGALVWRGGVRPIWPVDRRLTRRLLGDGAPLALSAFLTLAYQQADKLLSSRFVGDRETGYLTVAFIVIFGVVEILNTTVLTALYPMMSRSYDGGRSPLFGFMIEKLTIFTVIICLPITLVIALFAPHILAPLFGEDFRPAAAVLQILIIYALLMMTGNICAQGMLVQNRQRRLLLIRAAGLGVNLALLLALLPRLGILGAAVSSVCAEGLALALIWANFHAEGWDVRRLFPPAARLTGAAAVAAAAMLALRSSQPALAITAGLGLYALALARLPILGRDDWDLAYRLLTAMPGGTLVRRWWRRAL